MSEMHNRVREAIRRALEASDPDGSIKEDAAYRHSVRLDGWFALDAVADAAMEALREPTDSMKAAANWVEGYANISRQTDSVAQAVWRAMIGEALKD